MRTAPPASGPSRCPLPRRPPRASIRPPPWPAIVTWTCCWPRSRANSTRTSIPPSMPGWCTRWLRRSRALPPPIPTVPPGRRAQRPQMLRPDPRQAVAAVLALLLTAVAAAQVTDGGQRIAALGAAEREELQRRAADWNALPAPMRRARREAWLAWRSLPAHERADMQAAREAWRELPIDRQQALRARFDALDAGIRRGWLLGPVLGADWPQLHALFAQVAPDEREALLRALRALPAQGRDDLGVLAQRTPPQDRAALRAGLLAQPADKRAHWLRRRVDP